MPLFSNRFSYNVAEIVILKYMYARRQEIESMNVKPDTHLNRSTTIDLLTLFPFSLSDDVNVMF